MESNWRSPWEPPTLEKDPRPQITEIHQSSDLFLTAAPENAERHKAAA
jgi:hypothetical protein